MVSFIFYSLLVGLAQAGPFQTTTESQDPIRRAGGIAAGQLFNKDSPALGDRELLDDESQFAFPEPVDEGTNDFDYGNAEFDGVDSVEGDVAVGSFRFIPGGVELFSEGSGLPEHEEQDHRWFGESDERLEAERPAGEDYGRVLPRRGEDYTDLTERKNDEPAKYDAGPRTETGREIPEKNKERPWFGDIVALKMRMSGADYFSADSTSD